MKEQRFIAARAALALVAGVVLLWTADLRGAVMLSPTSVTTDMGESVPGSRLNMINQSGLDKPFTNGVTDFDAYFTTGDPPFAQAAGANNWQSTTDFSLPVTGSIDFDFGAVYPIDRFAIWNISLKDIRVLVSDTSIASLQQVATFSLPNHLNFPFSYTHDMLNLGGTHSTRFMRIQVDSTHLFSPSDTFGFAIVGEVVASVPEPATGGLLAAFGLLITARRAGR